MFRKFYYKLIVSFLAIILLIILPLIIIFGRQINQISEQHIETNLEGAQEVFQQFNNFRRSAYQEGVESLIKTHPQIRAILGSFGREEEGGDLFGEDPAAGPPQETAGTQNLQEINERLYSVVEDLPLYQSSQIFVLADSKGKVLFTKNGKGSFGQEMGSLPIVQTALGGRETFTWWKGDDEFLKKLSIVPAGGPQILYDVFFIPVIFPGEGIKGLLMAGHAIGPPEIALLKKIGHSEIAFYSQGKSYGESLSLPFIPTPGSQGYLKIKNALETYILLPKELTDGLGHPVATSVVFRPLSKELASYRYLERVLNILALSGLVMALILSLIISGAVTKVIGILIKAVGEVKEGNLDYQIVVKTKDEFHQLAMAIQDMCKGLKDKESITRIFKKYVDVKVADNILEKMEDVRLGGEKRDSVIFFSDIANFTTLSENLGPEQVVDFLNRYLGRMSTLVRKFEGVVDKYVGDAIVAYWDLAATAEACRLCCLCALEQYQALKELRESFKDEGALKTFDFRIGIHRGSVVIGNIGSESRMNHTIIGDSVNTASRLEELNKTYQTHIIVSQEVRELVGELFLFRELDLVTVKGKVEPTRIFELMGHKDQALPALPDQEEMVHSFEQALILYRRGDFAHSLELFQNHALRFPGDGAVKPFLARCKQFKESPPAEWNGVYNFQFK